MAAAVASAPSTITIDNAFDLRKQDDELNAGGPSKVAGRGGRGRTASLQQDDQIDPATGLPVNAISAQATLKPEEGDGFRAARAKTRSYRATPVTT